MYVRYISDKKEKALWFFYSCKIANLVTRYALDYPSEVKRTKEFLLELLNFTNLIYVNNYTSIVTKVINKPLFQNHKDFLD